MNTLKLTILNLKKHIIMAKNNSTKEKTFFFVMSTTKWIFTVPHGNCKDVDERMLPHPCDYIANKAALLLERNLQKVATTNLFLAPSIRYEGDLNRIQTKDNPWHQLWINAATTKEKACVLDIHSYPDREDFKTSRSISLVVLESNRQHWPELLCRKMPKKCVFREGSQENYITVTCVKTLHCPATILEFYEKTTESQLQDLINELTDNLIALSIEGQIKTK